MARLVRVDIPEVLRRVASVCARHPEVLAAYLFGSALGEMRPDSDIDVGIVLHPGAEQGADPWGFEGPLEADLGWVGTHPPQVTVLSAANAIFTVKALTEARLAYVADADRLSDFLEHVARLNWQNAWRYWAAVREVNGWDPHPMPNASPAERDT